MASLFLAALFLSANASAGNEQVLSANASAENEPGDYKLGPLDKVRVKAYEWRPSRDEIFEWKALNDEFTIGPEGVLALPLIGEISASGISTGELAKRIADRLRSTMGSLEPPSTTVEVVSFRPFYITGDVSKPGEYAYRPELTVLQAVAIAGGLFREADIKVLERGIISARGDLSQINMELVQLIAQRSRLEAELKGDTEVKFPAYLMNRKDFGSIALLLQQEQLIFDSRRTAFETELKALEELSSSLKAELESVTGQVQSEEKQLGLAQKELEGLQKLMKQGLSTSPRTLGLERQVAQHEGDRLRMQAALTRARQELGKTSIAMLQLRNRRSNEITIELRQTQVKIEELSQRFDTTERMLLAAEVGGSQSSGSATQIKSPPKYAIVRSGSRYLVGSETTPIEPGDTIKVEFLPPSLPPSDMDTVTKAPFGERISPRALFSEPRSATE